MLTIGTGVSPYPGCDPLDDLRWADAQPGIDGAWLLDHLQGWFPRGVSTATVPNPHELLDPFPLLAAGAAATGRVRLGVAVTDPVRRSAVALAHTASTTSWLGGRRMVLGLGVGDPGQLRPFGLHDGTERTGRLDYMRPAVRDLQLLRDTGGLTPDGPRLAVTGTAPFDIHVAAHGPRMLELTARHADGWLPTSLGPEDYGQRLAVLREHAERRGRDPATITPGLFLWTAMAPTRAESRALLAHPTVRAVALYRGPAGFAEHGATYPLPHAYVPHDVGPERAARLLADIPDAVVASAVLHGSPADIRERIDRYAAAGCQHVILFDVGRFTEVDGTERARAALTAVLRDR